MQLHYIAICRYIMTCFANINMFHKVVRVATYTRCGGIFDIHIHTRAFNGSFPGLPWSAGTRKVKPIWISLKEETVSGSGIRWGICKYAACSRQTTTPAPHHSGFTGRMPFLPPDQQCQSTKGIDIH